MSKFLYPEQPKPEKIYNRADMQLEDTGLGGLKTTGTILGFEEERPVPRRLLVRDSPPVAHAYDFLVYTADDFFVYESEYDENQIWVHNS